MALSWIRHPEARLRQGRLAARGGHQLRRTEGGLEALARTAGAQNGEPDRDDQYGGHGRAGEDETARRPHSAGTSLGLDARPQSRRRLDLGRSASCQRDRALLLRQTVGELRGGGNLLAKSSTALRVERSVGERRQLGDLILVVSPASHRHTKGNAVGMAGNRLIPA